VEVLPQAPGRLPTGNEHADFEVLIQCVASKVRAGDERQLAVGDGHLGVQTRASRSLLERPDIDLDVLAERSKRGRSVMRERTGGVGRGLQDQANDNGPLPSPTQGVDQGRDLVRRIRNENQLPLRPVDQFE